MTDAERIADLEQQVRDLKQAEREISRENGRLLASQREHLVAAGIDPAELSIPMAPPLGGTGYTTGYVQRLRAERADAWDEGYQAAYGMARGYGHPDHWDEDDEPTNPFRIIHHA